MQQDDLSAPASKAHLEKEETALLAYLVSGDTGDECLSLIVDSAMPRLARFIRKKYPLLAAEDAAEIAAKALDVAIKKAGDYVPEKSEIGTWLYGIALIEARRFASTRRHQLRLVSDDSARTSAELDRAATRQWVAEQTANDFEASGQGADRAEFGRFLLDLFEELPEKPQRAMRARYLEPLAPKEIDARYGWRRGYASVLLNRGHAHIRQRLLERGIDPSEGVSDALAALRSLQASQPSDARSSAAG
jgi:RNA polymerase sigma factor (sigma-70 family)